MILNKMAAFIGDLLGGGGSSSSVVTNILNDILTESFLSVTNNCRTDVDIGQTIAVDVTKASEDTSQCARCFDALVERQAAMYAVIRKSWERPWPQQKLAPDPNEGRRLADDLYECRLPCKTMIVDELTQTNMFSWKTSCAFDTNSLSTMMAEVESRTQQALTSKKDVLAALGDILGRRSATEVTNDIVSRLKTKISVTFINELISVVRSQQNITVSGATANVSNIAQYSSVAGISELFVKTNVANSVFTVEEHKAFQESYSTNTTISDTGDAIARTFVGLSNALQTPLFIGLMCALAVLALLLLVVIGVSAKRAFASH